jgi:hypothetical protein
MKFSSS